MEAMKSKKIETADQLEELERREAFLRGKLEHLKRVREERKKEKERQKMEAEEMKRRKSDEVKEDLGSAGRGKSRESFSSVLSGPTSVGMTSPTDGVSLIDFTFNESGERERLSEQRTSPALT